MSTVRTYRDLDAWQAGMALVERCYLATKTFPSDERYGLTSQLRRAAVSIPSNIAEGWCRRSTAVYVNHVSIALGSHGELETCIEIASRLGYLSSASLAPLNDAAEKSGQLLNGLLRSLEHRLPRQKRASS